MNALHVLEDEGWVKRLVEAFNTLEPGSLRPHVDRVFPAEQVAEAHTYLQTKQARGKLLLSW